VSGPLKLGRDVNKPLLVAAVGDLPAEVTRRKKMGFTLPFDAWFRGPLQSRMESMLLEDGGRLGLFRTGAVEGLWSSFLARAPHVSHSRVWTIAALASWCQVNGVTL
jgi:hypothetical protein